MLRGWLVPLSLGFGVGLTLLGMATAAYDVSSNCVERPLTIMVDGVDQSPWRGQLPDGNPGSLICNGRAYLPIRWVSSALGKQVGWDGATYTVDISGLEWSSESFKASLAGLQTNASGTTAALMVENTAGHPESFTFRLRVYDGNRTLLGTISGPNTPVQLAPGARQQITASTAQDLSGYAHLVLDPIVTPAGLHPAATRTGRAPVDRVIDAVMQRGATGVGSLATLTPLACTGEKNSIPGQPICPPGTPAGELIPVFSGSSCQPFFHFTLEQARQYLSGTLARPLYVYAVYSVDQTAPGTIPVAYGVVLAGESNDPLAPTLLLSESGQIVGVEGGCGTPDSVIPQNATLLLPPVH